MTKYALFIDYEYCSGCHSCELACRNELGLGKGEFGIKVLQDGPRQFNDGTWVWDYVVLPSEKCTMCEGRIEQGLEPSCVQHCQAKVLKFGTPEQCAAMLAEKGKKAAIFMP